MHFLFCFFCHLGALANAFDAWRDGAAEQAEIKAKTLKVLQRMLNGKKKVDEILFQEILQKNITHTNGRNGAEWQTGTVDLQSATLDLHGTQPQ